MIQILISRKHFSMEILYQSSGVGSEKSAYVTIKTHINYCTGAQKRVI